MREVAFGSDGVFTPEDFISRVNYDLANDLGNLLNRTVAMINKYFDGKVPAINGVINKEDADLQETAASVIQAYQEAMDQMEFSDALKKSMDTDFQG